MPTDVTASPRPRRDTVTVLASDGHPARRSDETDALPLAGVLRGRRPGELTWVYRAGPGAPLGVAPAPAGRPARSRVRSALAGHPGAYRLTRRAAAIVRFLVRRPHEHEFAVFGWFADRGGLFLDVGANVGQSALSFRLYQRSAAIVAIEPHPDHVADLRAIGRLVGRFRHLAVAAGEADGESTLTVPAFRGVEITGEGSLAADDGLGAHWAAQRRQADVGSMQQRTHVVPVRRLDALGLDPEFVKIDVEGYEPQVLRGLMETLSRCRPMVLVERSEGYPAVRDLLATLDYVPLVYDPDADVLIPDDAGVGTNVIFLARPAVSA